MTQAISNHRLMADIHKAGTQIKDAETRYLHTLLTLEGVRLYLAEPVAIKQIDKLILDLKHIIAAMQIEGVDSEELLK